MEEVMKTWTKNDARKNKINIFKILLFGVLIGFTNYTFELFNDYSEQYYSAKNEAFEKKKPNSENLGEIKKYTQESNLSLYNKYLEGFQAFKKSKKKYNQIKEEEKFFGFNSIYFFMDRFGKNSRSFLFGIWVFFIFLVTYKSESKGVFIAKISVVIIFLSTTIFDYFWIFNTLQDMSKISYYLMTIFISLGIIYSLFYLFRDKKTYEDKLRTRFVSLAKKSIEMSSSENRNEMTEFIKLMAEKK